MANSTCWSYTWHLTDWTSCRPHGDSSCGQGVQRRGQRCVRGDGRPVSARFCDHLSQTGDTQVSCTVDCPVDCQLSTWSVWNSDQCGCGATGAIRNMTRSRHIVVNASPTGRPCSESEVQTKACPAEPCYTWRASSWSECQLQVKNHLFCIKFLHFLFINEGLFIINCTLHYGKFRLDISD